ncbi:FG-GAP-like repeat-containing protein [Nannocystis sp. ILAH1]|uniref:FG-GAP-like repeat-containing protein n=1 Tax=unclassified Nannocystis TaxID=2627009 RepID=UPI0022706355|nr:MULTISPECIES: FG-GAP-like repeat-containing protein [unclassified Nannocystis]MCY0992492.1 FG-GAP-like repeat-containing protein [Nannocystis sp. ILAH1]MCY1068917.1 FG-GAP-like repeat-containing protein [Nannocystis sp. RBIL2]
MTSLFRRSLVSAPLLLAACGDDGRDSATAGAMTMTGATVTATTPGITTESMTTSSGTEAPTTGGSESGSSTTEAVTTTENTGGIKFDLGTNDLGETGGPPPGNVCKVQNDMDAIGDCEMEAAPDSFAPALQWSFGANLQSMVTPLVGNFTDDNADGEIDLCDVPDVLFVAGPTIGYGQICELFVLDGATGTQHYAIPTSESLSCFATPAFADIDNDGLPEIVAIWNSGGTYRLKAFEHDGTLKWTNSIDGGQYDQFYRETGAVAIHDLDADGDAEIIFNHEVYDHNGVLLWAQTNPQPGELEASVGVDLDGDGKMEVVTGHSAYRHDGSVYWEKYPQVTAQAIPQIANLDDDPFPEVFITSGQGLWMLEHDGTVKWGPATPTGVQPAGYLTWMRPGTVHDFDGDSQPEYASSSSAFYAVYEGNPATVLWQSQVVDSSGAAGGTAFDFLGDGVAEAMYADEQNFRIYDGVTGQVVLTQARVSYTLSEYPIVADVDNDGSAEILVVSLSGQPALQVLRDAEDRWIQARRIWNQHAYYVTNVREDSTLPTTPVDNWKIFNTYRTNAQIEGGGLCMPNPPG